MTQREEFEAWYCKAYDSAALLPMESGCYLNLGAGMAWDAWQAAQVAQPAKPMQLLEVVRAYREYVDALPKDLVLPAMPGFDRDWADAVEAKAQPANPVEPSDVRSDIGIHLEHCFQAPYETSCKYGDDDCPATPKAAQPAKPVELTDFEISKIWTAELKATVAEPTLPIASFARKVLAAAAKEPAKPVEPDAFVFMWLLEAAEQEPHATPRLVNACRSARAAKERT